MKILLNQSKFLNRNQGKDRACTMYAISNALYYQYGEIHDPVKMWKSAQELSPDGDDIDGLNIAEVRKWVQKYGFRLTTVPHKYIDGIVTKLQKGIPVIVSVYSKNIGKDSSKRHALICRGVETVRGKTYLYLVNSWNQANNFIRVPFVNADGTYLLLRAYCVTK